MNNRFLLALATLVGTIVGAGIFGLPYVVAQSGVILGLFYFLLLGGVVLLLHLMFGEIILRTQGKQRLIGYASLYLGGWAKKLVTASTFMEIIGALLAYIIIGGNFLKISFGSFISFSSFEFSIIFWFVLSLFILLGIQAIARMELIMNGALFFAVGGIFLFALPHMKAENFSLLDTSHLFLPYGVMLFAFLGLPAIPEIAELFKNSRDKQRFSSLIVWASVVSGMLFLVFTVFVVGVSGDKTSPDALSGLIPFLGGKVVVFGALFGLVAIAASFLVLGNYLKNSLRYDYKVPYGISAMSAIFLPLLLFVLGLRDFILVIAAVGAMVAVVEGSMVVLIWRKGKKKGDRKPEYSLRIPRFVPLLLVLLLMFGAVLELFIR